MFDTDGLILGYEVWVYRSALDGRYLIKTDRQPGKYDIKKAQTLQQLVRTRVSVSRGLDESLHPDYYQIARLKSNYYDNRWSTY